jgi:hypothetical protein
MCCIPGVIKSFFSQDVGFVRLLPSLHLVNSMKFQTHLALDVPLSSQAKEVTFVCSLGQYNSASSLVDAANNPTCVAPPVIRADTSNSTTTGRLDYICLQCPGPF